MSRDPIPPMIRQAARSAPLLDAETERDCLLRVQANEDPAAMAMLIRSHLRLALAMATRYSGRGVRMEDLVSEGVLGLCEAARRFDPARETRFATYAAWWVRAQVRSFALSNRRVVGMPSTRNARVVIGRSSRVERELTGKLGRPPTKEELSEALGVTCADVEMVTKAMGARDVSLTPREDGTGPRLYSEAPSPEEAVTEKHDLDLARRALREALDTLDERELEIVERRYLKQEGQTLRVVGEHMGLSRERVRQLEARAKDKLRRALAQVA